MSDADPFARPLPALSRRRAERARIACSISAFAASCGTSRSTPSRLIRCATFVARHHPAQLPDARRALPCPLAAFRGGRLRPLGDARPRHDLADRTPPRRASAFDLAIASVLLDAGAGPDWRYREDVSGESFARSEGLAVASFDMFASGALLRARPATRLRADARGAGGADRRSAGSGVPGRRRTIPSSGSRAARALLRRLGETVAANPAVFGRADEPRPGRPVRPSRRAGGERHAAGRGHPGRRCWSISARSGRGASRWAASTSATPGGIRQVEAADATSGLMPFHKLSQWLAYSLIEPLQDAGIGVSGIDALTGPRRVPQWRALHRYGRAAS